MHKGFYFILSLKKNTHFASFPFVFPLFLYVFGFLDNKDLFLPCTLASGLTILVMQWEH